MIKTTDIPESSGGGLNKMLIPGNHKIKVNDIIFEVPPFDNKAISIKLQVEGESLGKDFQGFFRDAQNESKGRHEGQVATVKTNPYGNYSDKTFATGEIVRDTEILKFLNKFCEATNCSDWLIEQDEKFSKISDLLKAFKKDAPFKDVYFYACLAGKEYEAKNGRVNNEIFFPKFNLTSIPFANLKQEEIVVKYEPNLHFTKLEKGNAINNFQKDSSNDDFSTNDSADDADDDDLLDF